MLRYVWALYISTQKIKLFSFSSRFHLQQSNRDGIKNLWSVGWLWAWLLSPLYKKEKLRLWVRILQLRIVFQIKAIVIFITGISCQSWKYLQRNLAPKPWKKGCTYKFVSSHLHWRLYSDFISFAKLIVSLSFSPCKTYTKVSFYLELCEIKSFTRRYHDLQWKVL